MRNSNGRGRPLEFQVLLSLETTEKICSRLGHLLRL